MWQPVLIQRDLYGRLLFLRVRVQLLYGTVREHRGFHQRQPELRQLRELMRGWRELLWRKLQENRVLVPRASSAAIERVAKWAGRSATWIERKDPWPTVPQQFLLTLLRWRRPLLWLA